MLNHFDQPGLLLLLLLAVPLTWWALRTFDQVERWRRYTAIGLRLAVLVMLVLILAGLRVVQTHDDLTVMAVVDRSESVRRFTELPILRGDTQPPPRGIEEWVARYLTLAGSDRRGDDSFGWIAYDGRASVMAAPRPRVEIVPDGGDAGKHGTQTARAIELALAAKADPDTAMRLVLVSDGNDTAGDTLAAARAAAAAGIFIDVLPLPYRQAEEVMVEGVYAPPEARKGQTVSIRVVLRGTAPLPGRLALQHDQTVVDLDPAEDQVGLPIRPGDWRAAPDDDAGDERGRYVLVRRIDVPLREAGGNRFRAFFEPEGGVAQAGTGGAPRSRGGDAVAVNNRGEGFTLVAGKGKILILDGVGGEPGEVLAQALARKGVDVEIRPPSALPRNLRQLQRYDAVILQNVPRQAIPEAGQRLLVQYVHDLGGGFAMLGGDRSFGAGAWTNSELDRVVLPVTCEVPNQNVLPSGALVFCIDRSGSMGAAVAGTGKTQQDIANEAALLALSTLYAQDIVGVVAFDTNPNWIVPLQMNNNPGGVADKIRQLSPGGGTNIYVGLQQAYEGLAAINFNEAAIKHCILLTDGNEPAQNYPELMNKFKREGITLSTVGIGDMMNTALLQDLARLGGGTYTAVADPTTLPQIFIKEAQTIRKNLVKEEDFIPQRTRRTSPIIAGLNAFPPLRGLVVTGPRNDGLTVTPLLGPEGEPLLAHRQVGLGRSAAFTSDATNQWAVNWLSWDGYADFWKRTTDYIARPSASRGTDLFAEVVGDRLIVRVDAVAEGARGENMTLQGAVVLPDGSTQTISLEPTAPGLYETAIPAEAPGSYLLSLIGSSPDGTRSTVLGGTTRPAGQELRTFRPNHALLERVAAETGGRVLDPGDPSTATLFARDRPFVSQSSKPLRWALMPWLLMLLLLDVANRRIAYDPLAMKRKALNTLGAMAGAGRARRDAPATPGGLGALKDAKARAAQPQPTASASSARGRGAWPTTGSSSQPTRSGPARQPADATFTGNPADAARSPRTAAQKPTSASGTDATTPAKPDRKTDQPDEAPASTTNRLLAARKRAQAQMNRQDQ